MIIFRKEAKVGEIKHAVQRTGSVISVLGVIALICFAIYMGYITFVKPHFNPTPSTNQRADAIVNTENYYIEDVDKFFLGIKNIPFLFGHKIDIGIGLGKKVIKKDKEGNIVIDTKEDIR